MVRLAFRVGSSAVRIALLVNPAASSVTTRGRVSLERLLSTDHELTVLFDNEPTFVLHKVDDATFGVAGLPPGVTFRFDEADGQVASVELSLKGLPKDLYFARLGFWNGSVPKDRTVTLAVAPVAA